MTTAQKSKETRRMEMGSIFILYIHQQSLHICTLLHYNLKLPNVYVGIVGWIYRTKIDPISILLVSLFFLSSGHPYIFFHFTKCFFPYNTLSSLNPKTIILTWTKILEGTSSVTKLFTQEVDLDTHHQFEDAMHILRRAV